MNYIRPRPPDPRLGFNYRYGQYPYMEPKMNSPEKKSITPWLIVLFLVLIVVAVLLVYFLSDKIFKKGKYIGTAPASEQKDAGYGTYATGVTSACFTASGLCTDVGNQTITQECIPNPTTGLGCLDDEGNQTFAPKVTNQNCKIPCKSFTLVNYNEAFPNEQTLDSVCSYPSPYDLELCIPNSTIVPRKATKYTCYPNDTTGVNDCNFTCAQISGAKHAKEDTPALDPNSPLYVPACKTENLGKINASAKIITLNSFPWEIAFNLPPKGVTISKGYTIRNYITPEGVISKFIFQIIPPYYIPNAGIFYNPNYIELAELQELDSSMYVYDNCTPAITKPICGKEFYYTPIEIGSELTNNPNNPPVDPAINALTTFLGTPNCYANSIRETTTTFTNPYESGSGLYNPKNIGNFGYYNQTLTCLNKAPTVTITTPPYNIPGYSSDGSICAAKITDNTPGVSHCFGDALFNPGNLPISLPNGTNYPPTSDVYNSCITQYPDSSTPIDNPGIFGTCQYLPSNDLTTPANSQLDFTVAGLVGITQEFKNLIGGYIHFNHNDGNKNFMMTLQSSPCSCPGDVQTCIGVAYPNPNVLQETFGTCDNNPIGNQYGPIDVIFVFDGTDSVSGSTSGNYWDKPGCDQEMIHLVNSLDLIVSPRRYDSGTNTLYCDIFAIFNNKYYGYLSYVYDPLTSYAKMVFIPVEKGNINKTDYNYIDTVFQSSGYLPDGLFAITYDPTTFAPNPTYNIFAKDTNTGLYSLPIRSPRFDGITPLPNPDLSVTALGNTNSLTYTPTVDSLVYVGFPGTLEVYENELLPFNSQTINKQNGLYVGRNVFKAVNNQKTNPCVASTCNPYDSILDPNAEPCFPTSCNLFCNNI